MGNVPLYHGLVGEQLLDLSYVPTSYALSIINRFLPEDKHYKHPSVVLDWIQSGALKAIGTVQDPAFSGVRRSYLISLRDLLDERGQLKFKPLKVKKYEEYLESLKPKPPKEPKLKPPRPPKRRKWTPEEAAAKQAEHKRNYEKKLSLLRKVPLEIRFQRLKRLV